MTNEIYEKTPSLSLRLRVARAGETRKSSSNNLERHSSLFEVIRVESPRVRPSISNEPEFSRTMSNFLERRGMAAHG